jgi:hypothetical protein
VGVTDTEILEKYANEFIDVLKAYTGQDFELDRSIIKGVENHFAIIREDGLIAFLICIFGGVGSVIGKAIRIKNTTSADVFYDSAPFEHKKEVSCED